jgi:hypothetical protein
MVHGDMNHPSIEQHPRFRPRDKRSVWIFKITYSYERKTTFTGSEFVAEWLLIDTDGTIRIPGGYTWNGNSPKINLFDLAIIGTPDGIVHVDTMLPKTYYASLVHDALYQYYPWHKIGRADIDRLYYLMLKESSFKPAWLYFAATRCFGWMFVGRKENH